MICAKSSRTGLQLPRLFSNVRPGPRRISLVSRPKLFSRYLQRAFFSICQMFFFFEDTLLHEMEEQCLTLDDVYQDVRLTSTIGAIFLLVLF